MTRLIALLLAGLLSISAAFATSVTLTGAGKPAAGGGGNVPTYVNGNTFQNGAASVTTASVTKSAVVSGNTVIVTYCGVLPLTSVTFSDNQGNSYTNWSGIVNNASGGYSCAQAYAANITNAPTTFSGTTPTGATFVAVSVDEFSNILSVSPADGTASNTQNSPGTGANAVTSTSLTSAFSGDLIYGYIVSINSTGMTVGAGFTARQSVTSTFYSSTQVQGAAGSIACTATATNGTDSTISLCLALRHN